MTMRFILSSCSHASHVSPIMPKAKRKSTTNQGLVQSDSVMASKSDARLGVPASVGRIDVVRANMDNLIISSGGLEQFNRKPPQLNAVKLLPCLRQVSPSQGVGPRRN